MFEQLVANYEENKGTVFDAALCREDYERAATLLMDRLEDRAHRESALRLFQSSNPSGLITDFQQQILSQRKILLSREDVKATFATFGRSIHIDGPDAVWSY